MLLYWKNLKCCREEGDTVSSVEYSSNKCNLGWKIILQNLASFTKLVMEEIAFDFSTQILFLRVPWVIFS